MKRIRYSKYVPDPAGEMSMEDLLSALSDYLLQSGFQNYMYYDPPEGEQTLDDLRARIRSTIEYLDGFSEKDFENAATATISTPRWEGKVMSGADYLLEHAIPNFFFHLTMAYAILRHNGVDVGKRDYLGALKMR